MTLDMIDKILHDPDSVIELEEQQIVTLLTEVAKIFKQEPNLIRVPQGNILVVGDTHGNFKATKGIVARFLDISTMDRLYDSIVFLGDYVDKGARQIENINYLFALKLRFPQHVILLRGNHEDPEVNSRYGFRSAVCEQFGGELYSHYNTVFSLLPAAALTWNRILALHGGIARELESLSQIRELPKGLIKAENDILQEVLWNDPNDNISGFEFNFNREGFYMFGQDVFEHFMENNKLKLMIRAHEFSPDGYMYHFDNKLLTIFSCPDYRGQSKGAVAEITEKGELNVIEL